jgi:hypothetical protein
MSLDVRMLTEGPATGLTWRDLEGELKAKPAGLVEDLHLAFEMVIDDPWKMDRYVLVYTRGDPLRQRRNVNVTVVPTGEATAGGAIGGAVASMLFKTKR